MFYDSCTTAKGSNAASTCDALLYGLLLVPLETLAHSGHEASAQLERAAAAVQVAQSQLQLSDDAYQTRLRQVGMRPQGDGLVTVMAPIAGTIANQAITPGESVNEPGVPLMTILNGTGVWATANVLQFDQLVAA